MDTTAPWTRRPEALQQVLLHEIAHHFIILEHPAATWTCWLNEGLAGNLEVTQIEGGRSEFPLLNPMLLQVAQGALARRDPGLSLEEFLAQDWHDFHREGRKERNYALAWALVHYLLERMLPQEVDLGERLHRLYRLEAPAIARLEGPWVEFVRRYDLTGELLRRAGSCDPAERLAARWAVRQLGELPGLDADRVLAALAGLLGLEGDERRPIACASFLGILARRGASPPAAARAGLEEIRRLLEDPRAPVAVREAIAGALAAPGAGGLLWARPLVRLLEAEEPRLRVAAARALAAMGRKPTVANPRFWAGAPAAARRREVLEWQAWLEGPAAPELRGGQ